ARSVAFWVNISSASPSQTFITLSNGYSAGLEIGLHAGVLSALGWNGLVVMSTAAPTRDAWHHVVHTYDAGQNKLYVDGVLADMATAIKGAVPTSEVWLGSSRGRDLFFGGQLDDIRIYDHALTAATVTALNNGASAVIDPATAKPTAPIPDLVGYWKMDESIAGTVLADSSGQGSTGIPVNRPAPADPMRNVVFANPHSLSFFNNQCAYLTNSGALNFTGAITISAWIYPTVQSGLRQVFGHGPADAETGLRLDSGSYAVYAMNATSHMAGFAIPTDDLATWIHLAGTYDGTAWRLYRNGRQIAVSVDATGAVLVNGNWGIAGTGACDARFFQGNIDDLRLYKRGLLPEEIRRIARGEL
ncbi:MAG TPA: LamG domain-containing protein, partial [Polyangia bacterium]|nr:LamG domain-containing protein [Polyangia bacterium]